MDEDIREQVRQNDPRARSILPKATSAELEQLNGALASAFIRAKKSGMANDTGKEFYHE